MSRIGKKPVALPAGVKVTIHGAEAVVEGSKGKLSCPILPGITLDVQADSITLARPNDDNCKCVCRKFCSRSRQLADSCPPA